MEPEDQKPSRTDNVEHEWVDVNPMSNYDGYVYWGEYPLTFAACLGQEECYRLVLARGAELVLSNIISSSPRHHIFFIWNFSFTVLMRRIQMEIQQCICW